MAFHFLSGKLFADMFRGGAERLRSNAKKVNQLNVFPVPDGDTGDNMSMTMEGGVKALSDAGQGESESGDLGQVAGALSDGMLLGARGNSGVILSQFFAGIAKGFAGCRTADVVCIGRALTLGVEAAYAAVLSPTEGTILTVARESVQYAVSRIEQNSTVESLFADLSEEADRAVARTPEALAVLREAGVVDSGGSGLKYIIEGFLMILKEEKRESEFAVNAEPQGRDLRARGACQQGSVNESDGIPGTDFESRFGYCTELLIQLTSAKCAPGKQSPEVIKTELAALGNSVAVVKSGSLLKIHVHTGTPDRVLALGLSVGELLKIKIENMDLQERENKGQKTEAGSESIAPPAVENAAVSRPVKPTAVVCVANGEGIEQFFKSLGVDEIVRGGQTMNPSAEDFLVAFARAEEAADTRRIIVFPNNTNIILAAKQAAALWNCQNKSACVYVAESHSIGEGYVGFCALDGKTEDAEEQMRQIREAMSEVLSGSVTQAVRDSRISGLDVKAGDYLGLLGGEAPVIEADLFPCVKSWIEKMLMLMPHSDTLTFFCGADLSASERESLEEQCVSAYPDLDVRFFEGGQPLYPLLSVLA